ncbi:hypothetical protein [Alkalihalobacterium alkalinitrilicum]|uniref:hypothetical protein n=1 Tax=Alkalihalobacterium alkalinitrilicum TaxID=427920 RepID=UPI00130390A4|nr:hypothetical protein [Alkalihalobacterium alkalinitrilicum]
MVEEIIRNPEVVYNGSILEHYYENYQPNTFYDFYFVVNRPRNISYQDKILLKQNINQYNNNSPWSDTRKIVKLEQAHEHGLARKHGIQHYGPVSKIKGELELQRLKKVFLSIDKNGYNPNDYNGHIKGHFIKYNDDYRFLITNGIHRTAVLCAMNKTKIPVVFEPNFPRVLDFNDLKNFPQVRNRVFSEQLAEQIFLSYFKDNGTRKAKKLGLL